jgi:hypothetical protein
MKYRNKNVAIHYFTNPAMENESLGKIVDGVMIQVAREIPTRKVNVDYEADHAQKMNATSIPSILFTDASGDTRHLYIDGKQMSEITVKGVTDIIDDILTYYKKGTPDG